MYLLLVTVFWGAVALLWEVVAMPLAVRSLAREPALKSRTNLLAVAASSTYIAGAFAYGWFLWKTKG